MKVIIAGSRYIMTPEPVHDAIEKLNFGITEVVSGTARGVDRIGEMWAKTNGVSLVEFPADWNKHGRSAGMIRNKQMADYADALIAVWDGESKGAKGLVDIAMRKGLKVFVYEVGL